MTAPTTTFLAETHERFLKAVVQRLPLERIIELHLFPSIRQGGVESGVAVVAAVPEGERATPLASPAVAPPVEAEAAAETPAADDAAPAEEAPVDEAPVDEVPLEVMPLEALVSAEDACIPPLAEAAGEEAATDDAATDDAAIETASSDAAAPALDAEDAERLEEAVHLVTEDLEDPAAQAMAAASLELADLPATDERPRRYTIYAARYRLVLKGPDRGKWEVSVTAEADAPLVTVETVVRGVQRRSGDADEVGRWTGEELRTALRL